MTAEQTQYDMQEARDAAVEGAFLDSIRPALEAEQARLTDPVAVRVDAMVEAIRRPIAGELTGPQMLLLRDLLREVLTPLVAELAAREGIAA